MEEASHYLGGVGIVEGEDVEIASIVKPSQHHAAHSRSLSALFSGNWVQRRCLREQQRDINLLMSPESCVLNWKSDVMDLKSFVVNLKFCVLNPKSCNYNET